MELVLSLHQKKTKGTITLKIYNENSTTRYSIFNSYDI